MATALPHRNLLICLALALATFAAYAKTFSGDFEFINVDDPDYVTGNPHVQAGLTGESLSWALTAFHAHNWHPLTWMSLQLDHQLFGLSARGFHFTNVLLHAANAVLLFWLLQRLTGAVWRSAAVAAIFALHPTHVESVAWVTERKDVLSTLFWLLTMAAYGWYAERPGLGRYAVVLLTFALGLMAKPMLVTLPPVLLLMDYWPLRRWRANEEGTSRFASASLSRLLLEKVPLFLLVAASIPLTIMAQQMIVKTVDEFMLAVRVQNALVSYVQYIGMLFWPSELAILYPHRLGGIPLWQSVAAAVLLLVVTLAFVLLRRTRPYLLVGWLWYLGTLVPVIGLVQVGMHALADRYTYVPHIGLSIAVVWGIADLTAEWRQRAVPLAVIAGGLLLASFVLTWKQVSHWRNSEALWRHTLAVTHDNGTAHDYLADTLRRQGRLDESEQHLRHSLRIHPDSALGEANLAALLQDQGKLEEAAVHLQRALRLSPRSAAAHLGMGRLHEQQGNRAGARVHYTRVLEINPNSADARTGLAALLEDDGRLAEALEQYEAIVRLRPLAAETHNNLGRVLKRLGKPEEALARYERALQLQPGFAEAHNNRGVALESLGRMADALLAYDRAVDLKPDFWVFRCNVAYALHETGQQAAAKTQYNVATQLHPGWPKLAVDQAWLQATHADPLKRNGQQALRTAKQACQATDFQMPRALEVLAAAHAELGQFADADRWQRKALEQTPSSGAPAERQAMQERLKLYESGKPYR